MMNIGALAIAVSQRLGQPPCQDPGVLLPLPGRIDGATPGCYALPLTDTEYHRQTPGVSSTMLKQLMRSPAHYRAWLASRDRADTQARRFGRAVHCRVLEPALYDSRYVVWRGPDRRSVAYRQFEVAHASRCVLTADEHERVIGCAEALRTSDDFPMSGFLDGRRLPTGEWKVEPARAEFSIIWVDEPTGLTCKVRLDALMNKPVIALDVKTCGDARPQAFTRDIGNLHYDFQAAFYMEGVRRFTGASQGTWIFAAVEAEPPHAAVFYGLGPGHELLQRGARKYRHALDLMARCEADGHWPSYEFGDVITPPSRQQSLHRWSGMSPITSPAGPC